MAIISLQDAAYVLDESVDQVCDWCEDEKQDLSYQVIEENPFIEVTELEDFIRAGDTFPRSKSNPAIIRLSKGVPAEDDAQIIELTEEPAQDNQEGEKEAKNTDSNDDTENLESERNVFIQENIEYSVDDIINILDEHDIALDMANKTVIYNAT